jgi:hypothetical protein
MVVRGKGFWVLDGAKTKLTERARNAGRQHQGTTHRTNILHISLKNVIPRAFRTTSGTKPDSEHTLHQ